MAQCALSSHEFVQNAFNPVAAVLCSPQAESVCQKNNLSFVEMVQPFCKLKTDAHLRDPMNQSFTIRNLRVNLCEMNYDPPKQLSSRKILHEIVANTIPNLGDRTRLLTLKSSGYTLQINNATPWFEAYRECFLKNIPLSDHEFTTNFIACILVVAVSDAQPMNEFARMLTLQHNHQFQNANKSSRWFFSNTPKYYVLLQDVTEDDSSRTESLYLNMKSMYGANLCHLLRINSGDFATAMKSLDENQPNLPDPWSQFLARRVVESEVSYPEQRAPFPVTSDDRPFSQATDETESISVMDHPLMPHHLQKSPLSSSFTIEIIEETASNDIVEAVPVESKETFLSSPSSGSELFPTSSSSTSLTPLQPSPSDVRSRSASTIPHGMCLTVTDMEQIRLFIHDFCTRALLPAIEKQMAALHEAVTNRKGLHRSFFSATKKWFGGNKPAPTTSSSASFIVYSPDAVELQVRRLGDLAFMFQHYELAYNAYHNVKRDFNSDQAWMHYAGALEMAALAVFMHGVSSQRQLPFHYFDNAINIYLNTCNSPLFATRATLLATECLKHQERYLEAASYFIKLTSEESDLRSALLLEQAAHCFASLRNTCVRKYSFYIILAGHRFNKAGQKKHSLRCYKQALQVYQDKQWLLAEDHINLTAGRLSFNLNYLDDAVSSFHKLLYDGCKQTITQQAYYVREYIAICSHFFSQQNGERHPLSQLPLPIIDSENCVLLLGNEADSDQGSAVDNEANERSWCHLEEIAVIKATGCLPVRHRPMLRCYNRVTDNSVHPLAVIDEPLVLQLSLRNPLKISISLTEIYLLWTFTSSDGELSELSNNELSGEQDSWSDLNKIMETLIIPELILDAVSTVKINLVLIPRCTGELKINGVAYSLMTQATPVAGQQQQPIGNDANFSVRGMQPLQVTGPRLTSTKDEKCSKVYGQDFRLEPLVVPPMPSLSTKFNGFPSSLLCGQVASFVMELDSCGSVGISRLFIATHTPHLLTFGRPFQSAVHPQANPYVSHLADVEGSKLSYDEKIVFTLESSETFSPGRKLWLPVWIRGPSTTGLQTIDLLFYYQTVEQIADDRRPRYRVMRRQLHFTTQELLCASAVSLSGADPVGKSLLQSFTLAVELANISQITDEDSLQLRLSQVSCISQSWSIEKLNCSAANEVQIGPKETLNLCFRIAERKNLAIGLTFSNAIFQDEEIDNSSSPCFDFYQKAINNTVSLAINKDEDISEKQNDEYRRPHVLDITIVLLWKAYNRVQDVVFHGQHSLAIRDVDTLISTRLEANLAEDKEPARFDNNVEISPVFPTPLSPLNIVPVSRTLRYMIFSDAEIKHDFTKTRMCIVPVFLVLFNCAEFTLDVMIETSRPPTSKPSSDLSPSVFTGNSLADVGRFTWVGLIRISTSLKPLENRLIRLKACFMHRGAYSLSGVSIRAKPTLETNQSNIINVKGSSQILVVDGRANWDINNVNNFQKSI